MSARRESREQIMERFRAMIARNEPIVGGGAGTGLSAKCEEAGGIDLIVIYNSGPQPWPGLIIPFRDWPQGWPDTLIKWWCEGRICLGPSATTVGEKE